MSEPVAPSVGAWLRSALASRTARDTLTNTAGTGAAAVLSFGSLVIATNTLGPAGFGLFALTFAVLSIASELADLGVNAGLIRHASSHLGRGDPLGARTVLSVAFRAKLVTATAAGLLVFALANPAARALDRANTAPLLRIAAVGIAGMILFGLTSATLQAHQRFARNAILISTQWVLRLSGTAALALSEQLTPESLLGVYAISPWITFGLGLVLVPRRSLTLTLWDAQRAREVFHFSRWIALWAAFWVLLTRADLLLLGALSSDDQVGFFATSQRVILLVTMLVNAYLMTLIPQLSRVTDLAALRQSMRRATGVSIFISVLVALGIPAAPLIVRLFGAEFSSAAPVLAILLVGAIFQTLALSYNAALYALNRPRAFALASGLGLLISIIGNVLLVPRFGARGAAVVAVVVGIELLAVAFLAARRALRSPDARLNAPLVGPGR